MANDKLLQVAMAAGHFNLSASHLVAIEQPEVLYGLVNSCINRRPQGFKQVILNQDFSLRQPGQPWVLTDKEIKEHKKEQIRKYLINRKAKQNNTPKSSTIGQPRLYTEEEVKQRKRERIQRHYRENKEQCIKRSRRWQLQCQVEVLNEKIGAC